MSGEEAVNVRDGDYLRLTHTVEFSSCQKWQPDELLQVEFTEIFGGGRVEWWVRNLAREKEDRKPSVEKIGMYMMLNYMHKVVKVTNMNHTVIEHKLRVGDEGWVMVNNAPCKIRVTHMTVNFAKDPSRKIDDQEIKPCIKYYGSNINDFYTEDKIFATKDELLDSLR